MKIFTGMKFLLLGVLASLAFDVAVAEEGTLVQNEDGVMSQEGAVVEEETYTEPSPSDASFESRVSPAGGLEANTKAEMESSASNFLLSHPKSQRTYLKLTTGKSFVPTGQKPQKALTVKAMVIGAVALALMLLSALAGYKHGTRKTRGKVTKLKEDLKKMEDQEQLNKNDLNKAHKEIRTLVQLLEDRLVLAKAIKGLEAKLAQLDKDVENYLDGISKPTGEPTRFPYNTKNIDEFLPREEEEEEKEKEEEEEEESKK